MWTHPGPGIKPISSALAGRFLNTEPPGKSSLDFFGYHFLDIFKIWIYSPIPNFCLIQKLFLSVLFSSVTQLCPTRGDPMNCSTLGLPVHHQLPEFTQTHDHRVGDAIQPSHPLLSPSPPALNLSKHQGLLQWVSSSHQVAKVLEFQLQHQSFQWIPRTNLLQDGLVGLGWLY